MVGNEFVKMARSKTRDQGGFGDVTGNLRSSIGFVIVDHGNIVESGFEQVVNGNEGMNKAQQLTRELSDDFMDGFALIVVAGMEYAAAVENRHHKDVITGSSVVAEAMLKSALKRIKQKVSGL